MLSAHAWNLSSHPGSTTVVMTSVTQDRELKSGATSSSALTSSLTRIWSSSTKSRARVVKLRHVFRKSAAWNLWTIRHSLPFVNAGMISRLTNPDAAAAARVNAACHAANARSLPSRKLTFVMTAVDKGGARALIEKAVVRRNRNVHDHDGHDNGRIDGSAPLAPFRAL